MNKMFLDKPPIYSLEKVKKTYLGTNEEIQVLNGIDLNIAQGQSLAIIGSSGCGKSTLLHILGLLDHPTSGQVLFANRDISFLTDAERATIRNKELGFVFQFHHLMPEFSAIENVAMQAIIGGTDREKALNLAKIALDKVELNHRLKHLPSALSGGERQRVAIARAVLHQPKVLLADEPTGNLDDKTGNLVGNLLLQLNIELKMTLILVTHNRNLAKLMERSLELRIGELYETNN